MREMVKELKEFGIDVFGYDSLLSKEEIKGVGVNALDNLDVEIKMDGVIVAVAHDEFKDFLLAQAKFSFLKSVFTHINSRVRDMMLGISLGM